MYRNIQMSQTTEKEPLLSKRQAQKPAGWGYRHLLAILAFFGFFNVYCMRVNLSVAIVAMANSTSSKSNDSDECPVSDSGNTTSSHTPEFPWSPTTQGYILGSFFYGYIVTQIPGGWLSEKFGGKYLFGFGVLCTAVLTLLTPLAARLSVGAFIVVRVLEGLGEGVTFPAMHAMWGKWGPIYERSKLTGFSYAGAQLGTVFAMPISGVLCDHGFAGGWPSVFYVFGGVACIWFVIWMLVTYNTPADHPKISLEEREYIEAGVGKKEDLATPWGPILATPAVWAVCIAHFSNNWGFYTMLTTLPDYMKNVLKFDLKTKRVSYKELSMANGKDPDGRALKGALSSGSLLFASTTNAVFSRNAIISALPYLGCWFGQNMSGFIADFLRGNGYLSTLMTRRILTLIGLGVPGIIMICIQFAGCNHAVVVVLLVLCLTFGGLTMGGFQVNHIDLSPNFAGVLMGMSNSWATIPGFLGPQIVGWLTDKHNTRAQWQIVFYIAAGVYLAGAVLYFILSKGTVQPWNEPKRGVTFARKVRTVPHDSSHTQYMQHTDIED